MTLTKPVFDEFIQRSTDWLVNFYFVSGELYFFCLNFDIHSDIKQKHFFSVCSPSQIYVWYKSKRKKKCRETWNQTAICETNQMYRTNTLHDVNVATTNKLLKSLCFDTNVRGTVHTAMSRAWLICCLSLFLLFVDFRFVSFLSFFLYFPFVQTNATPTTHTDAAAAAVRYKYVLFLCIYGYICVLSVVS